jgi:hypothetical protein
MRHVTFLPQLGSLSPLTAGNRNFCGGPVGSKVKFPVRALAGRLHELQTSGGRGGSSSKLRDFVSQTRQSSIEFRGWSCAPGIFRPVGPLESGSPSSKVLPAAGVGTAKSFE